MDVGEGDGGGVPDRGGSVPGQGAADQERDAADVDGAVAGDGQFALAAGGDGPAPVRRSAPGGRVARGFAAGGDGVGVVARSGRPGDLGGVPGLLWGDAPGQALVGALGVVDVVEAVDLLLELGDGVGQGLLVQVAEQGLVEALVLALGGGPVGSAGGGVRRPGSARAPPGGR